MVRLLPKNFPSATCSGSLFQSHNGAIAAPDGSHRLWSTYEFQSHNGAIAALNGQNAALLATDVSIPQWCDCCQVAEIYE